ncbi:unnamed protein product [Strongylus vulgaris]|uniref:Transthyretin/hydroxyisourate hydrolase domain-containing protein n=1 Tax=Strongylus vulgaris TaxID=40348 RepID=A0A3P7LMJ5_STRVU|nr:unnamed protein product [Strongylus vulgaris]
MKSFLLLLAVVLVAVHAKMQNVTVKGTTICNKKRMADALVELWERDTRKLFVQFTSLDLSLRFVGERAEDEKNKPVCQYTSSIEKFFFAFRNQFQGCKRITEYEIPKSKIDSVYDMTYVTLDIVSAVDKEKC